MGVKKPEVAFFNYILEKLGTQDPSEVLYFDDAEENIKTAMSLGIQCVLFRSIDDLASIMNNQ
jgi:HAD superfamily hydrolase (TIGR01509 family)